MHGENVKEKYYTMFHNPGYHRYRETILSLLIEKQLKGIAFDKIISNQMFVSDRTTNIELSKMQNEIPGSLVTIQ